jgi:hypothetical protein
VVMTPMNDDITIVIAASLRRSPSDWVLRTPSLSALGRVQDGAHFSVLERWDRGQGQVVEDFRVRLPGPFFGEGEGDEAVLFLRHAPLLVCGTKSLVCIATVAIGGTWSLVHRTCSIYDLGHSETFRCMVFDTT